MIWVCNLYLQPMPALNLEEQVLRWTSFFGNNTLIPSRRLLPLRSLHITHPLITARTSTLSTPHFPAQNHSYRANQQLNTRARKHSCQTRQLNTNKQYAEERHLRGGTRHTYRSRVQPASNTPKVLHIIITLCARADDSVLILLARQVIKKALNTLRVREALYRRVLDNTA